MTTVLITAIGGDIAQSVAAIVRDVYPSWRLIGMDVQERHAGALFVDKVYRAPAAVDATYSEWLNRLIREQQVHWCIPMSEAELWHFAQRHQKEVAGATLVMPNIKAIEVGNDKLATANFLQSIGCPAPWTIAAETADDGIVFPCIFKPRFGAGSKAVFVCNTRQELAFYRARYANGIFQELLLPADKEVTCAVYRSQSNEIAVLQLLRTLVGGFTGWAQVIDDPEVANQCRRLAAALDLKGSINVQLRITDAGPRIFEINARFSSTALMRHRMGFQDVVWTIQELMQQKIVFQHPPVGTTAVRVQDAEVLHSIGRSERHGH